MLLALSEKKTSHALLNVEIGIMLVAKIEQFTKEELFPSRKLNVGGKTKVAQVRTHP